jgi:hypothetical protein
VISFRGFYKLDAVKSGTSHETDAPRLIVS